MSAQEHRQFRYRSNWRGKLILQVGELQPYNFDPQHDVAPGGYSLRWRDANVSDFHRASA